MKNYWSCSKFADWLRGTSKPEVDTSEGWDKWEDKAKKHRFRYWLAEEGLDYLQQIVYSPLTLINKIRSYFQNRFITKTHTLTSKLKPGYWYDLDIRLIECVFDELVNFVEIDLALESIWALSEENYKKYQKPWHYRIFRVGKWRCPEAGIAYLNWACELKYDEHRVQKSDSRFGKPTDKAIAAQEILDLYQWWKVDRPNRPNPDEDSEYGIHNEKNKANMHGYDQDIIDERIRMKKEQEDEDTEMLVRLIKIRKYLWT